MPGIDVNALLATLKGRPAGVASGGRQMPMDAIRGRITDFADSIDGGGMDQGVDMNELQGFQDARGPVGIMSRGANMYPGGGPAQQGGGSQYGAPSLGQPPVGGGLEGMMPPRNAVLRRIQAQRGNHGILA